MADNLSMSKEYCSVLNIHHYHPSFVASPRFLRNNTVLEMCMGGNIEIVCNAIGIPVPDVTLYIRGFRLQKSSANLTFSSELDNRMKFGTFICFSNNSEGIVNVTTIIKPRRKLINECNIWGGDKCAHLFNGYISIKKELLHLSVASCVVAIAALILASSRAIQYFCD